MCRLIILFARVRNERIFLIARVSCSLVHHLHNNEATLFSASRTMSDENVRVLLPIEAEAFVESLRAFGVTEIGNTG